MPRNELICPATNQVCNFPEYCRAAKEAEDDDEQLFGGPAVRLLDPIVLAANGISFCAAERQWALGKVEHNLDLCEKIRKQAAERADQISTAKIFFVE